MMTIGFLSHHVEVLPFLRRRLEGCRTLVLEEPPHPRFQDMLQGAVAVEDYLLQVDSGFPEFDRHLCRLLQGLCRDGLRILQVEPYLERLLQIHEGFAAGRSPADVSGEPDLAPVYEAEKRADGALLAYYQASVREPFRQVVEAVKHFARADADRLRLRARLRSEAIAEVCDPGESVFIEAGYIHRALHRELLKRVGKRTRVRALFVMDPLVREWGGKRRNLGPGDVLTLIYVFGVPARAPFENLLAARSLLYIKMIQKEELLPGPSPAPHCEDEIRVNRLVDRLTYEDCSRLFEDLRFASRTDTLKAIQETLDP